MMASPAAALLKPAQLAYTKNSTQSGPTGSSLYPWGGVSPWPTHNLQNNWLGNLSKWVCPQNSILNLLPPPGLAFLSFSPLYKLILNHHILSTVPQLMQKRHVHHLNVSFLNIPGITVTEFRLGHSFYPPPAGLGDHLPCNTNAFSLYSLKTLRKTVETQDISMWCQHPKAESTSVYAFQK
jgi:hypothetical protein